MGEYKAKYSLDDAQFAQAPSRIAPPPPWPPEERLPHGWEAPEADPITAQSFRERTLAVKHSAPVPPSGATATLFPILRPGAVAPARTGLARMVDESEAMDDGHLVEFRSLAVRSILNKSVSKRRLWFARTINPYRGCEFACRYCYARYTHEFLEQKDPAAFERKIFIKQNAAWLLEQELRSLDPAEEIAIGTATDPYQPIERRARVTRGILEVLARRKGFRIGIVTKSTLIERDIDVLQQIARHNELVLHITITTPDAELARKLEPRAPRPDLRFRTVERLRAAGLHTGILCSPLLPGLTDTQPALDQMATRARQVGASFFSAQPLFLKPCSRPVFLSFLREHYPELVPGYSARYEQDAFVDRAYAQRMRELVRAVCRKHGLKQRTMDAILTRDVGGQPAEAMPVQGRLWPAPAARSSLRVAEIAALPAAG